MQKIIVFVVALILLILPGQISATGEKVYELPTIQVFEMDSLSRVFEFNPFGDNKDIYGINLATGDITKDSFSEFIVGAGANHEPIVKIFDRNGLLLNELTAYAKHFKGGINVAVGDVDGDGSLEVVTGAMSGGGPHVRVFNPLSGELLHEFFAFDASLRGGVNISVGDVHPMSGDEIITSSGDGMEAEVRVYDRIGTLLYAFNPELSSKKGVKTVVSDRNGDGLTEIIVTPAFGDEPHLLEYTPNGVLLSRTIVFPRAFRGGVNPEFGKLGNYESALIMGAGFGGGAHVRFLNPLGEAVINPRFFPLDNFRGGVLAKAGNFSDHYGNELAVATQRIPLPGKEIYQKIEVDLTKQELIAYEFGREKYRSLVSSGLARWPTPTGEFKVEKKIPIKAYEWSYGPNNPNNYSLPGVKYNLMFKWPYYLHGTYWHNNFGTPMSHGCVNLPTEFAGKLYDWAEVGTPVSIFKSEVQSVNR